VKRQLTGAGFGIAGIDIYFYLTAYMIFVWNALCQTHVGQHSQLDFGNIQPTALLGGVMKFQSSR